MFGGLQLLRFGSSSYKSLTLLSQNTELMHASLHGIAFAGRLIVQLHHAETETGYSGILAQAKALCIGCSFLQELNL